MWAMTQAQEQVEIADAAVREHLVRMIAALSHDLAVARTVIDAQAAELADHRRKDRVAAAVTNPADQAST